MSGAPLAGLDSGHPWRQASVSVTSETETKPNGDGGEIKTGQAVRRLRGLGARLPSGPGGGRENCGGKQHATRRGHRPAPRGGSIPCSELGASGHGDSVV